jgi:DNA repair exonuclease SbcCD nuclease subunit
LELVDKCGINVLQAANKVTVWRGVHWGQKPDYSENKEGDPSHIVRKDPSYRRILVWHKMNYKGKAPWPGCTDPSALKLLKKYPQYDLILTGDNHKTFTEEYEGRRLVNPGSLMRMDADQVEHRPCVFLWYAEDNSIKQVFIPIEENVISREHIDQVKERNGRLDAFIKRLDLQFGIGKSKGSEGGASFEDNLTRFIKKNKTRPAIVQIIYKSIENEKD